MLSSDPTSRELPARAFGHPALHRGGTTLIAATQSLARARVTLAIFTILVALLYADQNLLAPSLTAIGNEFGFSRSEIDQRLGADINLVFWMLGGITTLAIGF